MPSPTTTDLPIPNSWNEFEDICSDLLKCCIWRDPYVVRHGRSGQRQHGVDIYGKPVHLNGLGSETAGAQCKRTEALTEAEIDRELKQAIGFSPPLEEYLLLTTLKRDTKLQKHIWTKDWEINRVEILFWEDLSLQLSGSDELLKKHFPQWFKTKTSTDDVIQMLVGAEPEDFAWDDSIGQHLYRDDVKLRLIEDRYEERKPFVEPWVSKFPDKKGYRQEVYLEYDEIRIEKFLFVKVDGARYSVPCPKTANDLRISPLQYHIARILNPDSIGYGIDHALEVAGIKEDPNLGPKWAITKEDYNANLYPRTRRLQDGASGGEDATA